MVTMAGAVCAQKELFQNHFYLLAHVICGKHVNTSHFHLLSQKYLMQQASQASLQQASQASQAGQASQASQASPQHAVIVDSLE